MNTPYSELNTELVELPDGIYWPFKRLPGSRLATYAFACVESALKYSEEAQAIYARIVQSWELPGCQALIHEMARPKEDTSTWLCSLDEALNGDKPLLDWPTAWTDAFATARDNADFCTLWKCAGYFVLMSFNRKGDLDNRAPKVIPFAPGKDPYLAMAVVVYSLMDYLAMRPEVEGPRAWSDESLTRFVRFCGDALAGASTTRKERESGQAIRQTLRREGYKLKHYSKMRRDAEAWYKCRVSPGTIEAYLDELAKADIHADLDRGNLENAIAPYDEATGYPRKWRK